MSQCCTTSHHIVHERILILERVPDTNITVIYRCEKILKVNETLQFVQIFSGCAILQYCGRFCSELVNNTSVNHSDP